MGMANGFTQWIADWIGNYIGFWKSLSNGTFGNWFGDQFSWLTGKSSSNGTGSFWDDLTGQSNTNSQNAAAAALQEDAQAFNSAESAKQREFEAAEAQKNRDWQEAMSNSAYQRSVADLQAAGLNPWLAVSNGASTPSAVSVVGDAASSGVGSPQASNVNLLQSLGTTAAGLGLLIKALKVAAK